MIPNNSPENPAIIGGAINTTKLKITEENASHLIGILRDSIYTDRILAILREYSTNAWDAHVSAGKKDLPINITLPTSANPVYRVRDYGPGISPEDMENIFASLGASTKRKSNEVVGTLGIGSKAGHAYAPTFQVTSYNGGMKRIYVVHRDDSADGGSAGGISLFHEEPTEETGLEIEIQIKPEDTATMVEKARAFFGYFQPRPVCNFTLPSMLDIDVPRMSSGFIRNSRNSWGRRVSEWYAVMGNVPYKLDLSQIAGLPDAVRAHSGVLFFDIGEVQFSASREELRYTKRTQDAVVAKFDKLMDEYHLWAEDLLKSKSTPWECYLEVTKAMNQLDFSRDLPSLAGFWDKRLDAPDGYELYTVQSRSWRNGRHKKTLGFYLGGHPRLAKDTKIVISDESPPSYEAHLRDTNDIVICQQIAKVSADDTSPQLPPGPVSRDEVDAWIKANGIEGIPVLTVADLETMRGHLKPAKVKVERGPSVLRLVAEHTPTRQRDWTVEAIPTDKEVVVIKIDRFKADMPKWDLWIALLNHVHMPVPTIYGIKSGYYDKVVAKHPNVVSFDDWRKKVSAEFVTKHLSMIENSILATEGNVLSEVVDERTRKQFSILLPDDHPAYVLLTRTTTTTFYPHQLESTIGRGFEDVFDKIRKDRLEKNNEVLKRYPLLSQLNHYTTLSARQFAEAVVQYIQAVDTVEDLRKKQLEAAQPTNDKEAA